MCVFRTHRKLINMLLERLTLICICTSETSAHTHTFHMFDVRSNQLAAFNYVENSIRNSQQSGLCFVGFA